MLYPIGVQLTSLDLTPLAQCRELERLYLSYNRLQSLDLSPLSQCTRLERLYLYNNCLTRLDLSPLSRCLGLEKLSLYGNRLTSLDLSPLFACPRLSMLRVDASVELIADSALKEGGKAPWAIEQVWGQIVWTCENARFVR